MHMLVGTVHIQANSINHGLGDARVGRMNGHNKEHDNHLQRGMYNNTSILNVPNH